jgi:SanA protein
MKRRAIRLILTAIVLSLLFLLTASVLINRSSEGRTYSDVRLIPHRPVGLILGCSKLLAGGYRNPFFQYRMAAAAELYHAGKVDYLLVSGDNHIHAYDEAKDMKNSLVELGVPPAKIYCDFAGFRTLDSVVRARDVFGQAQITIISQEFHNRRAIFIARHRGMDAIGFNAPYVDAYYSFKTHCREQLAKMNTILDIFVFQRRPRFYGPKVPIGFVPPVEPT